MDQNDQLRDQMIHQHRHQHEMQQQQEQQQHQQQEQRRQIHQQHIFYQHTPQPQYMLQHHSPHSQHIPQQPMNHAHKVLHHHVPPVNLSNVHQQHLQHIQNFDLNGQVQPAQQQQQRQFNFSAHHQFQQHQQPLIMDQPVAANTINQQQQQQQQHHQLQMALQSQNREIFTSPAQPMSPSNPFLQEFQNNPLRLMSENPNLNPNPNSQTAALTPKNETNEIICSENNNIGGNVTPMITDNHVNIPSSSSSSLESAVSTPANTSISSTSTTNTNKNSEPNASNLPTNLRTSRRAPKSCIFCYKRKIRCNRKLPCDVCIAKGRAHLCRRETVIVGGVIVNGNSNNMVTNTDSKKQNITDYEEEVECLRKKVLELELTIERLRNHVSSDDTDNKKSMQEKKYFLESENIKREILQGQIDSQTSDNSNSEMKQENTLNSIIPKDGTSPSSVDTPTKDSYLSTIPNNHFVNSKDSAVNNNKDSNNNNINNNSNQSIDRINNPEFMFFDQTIPKSQIFSLDTDLITTKMKDSEVVNHDMIASSKNSASGNNDGDTATSGANDNNGNSDDLKRKKKKRKIALRKDNWKIFSQTVNHLTRSLIHGIVEDELNHDFDKYFRDLKVKASNSPYVINVFGNHTESETIKPNVTPEEHKVLSVDKLSLWNEVLNWLPILDEEKSTIVVNYALDNLFFLRNLFDPVTFREEHKLFWTSNATEKHITLKYDRETDEYLWTGLWYAVLTAGFHYCDEDLQKALGFEEMFMNNFAQIFLCCALECVVRGRYMTFPNPRSIQVIQVLSLTCYAFGGDNLQKCSFHSAIYIARKLNFHKVSNNVKNNKILKNIWWNLVSTDWLNSYGRYSFILPNTFVTSLPDDFKLKDPANNNVEVFDVSTYYINVLSKIAIIKRKYYFDDNMSISCLNLISLKKADIELRLLEMNVEKCLRDNHPAKNLNLDPKSEYYKKYLIDYEFLKFILINSLIYHKFEVNKMMINFMNPNYWLSEISPICHHYCIDVLKNYLSPNTSRILQKLWFITEFVVVLACFLLVDVLIHDSPRVKNCQDSINLVNRIKLLLLGFKSLIRPAIRGLYVIDKLLQLIEQQKNKKTLIDLKDMMNMDLVNELSRATANNDPPPPRSRRGSISKSMSKEPTVSVLAKGNVAGKSAITMVNFIKNAYEEEHQSKSENENEISKSPLDMEKKEHSIDQEGKHSNNNSTTDYPQDEYSQVNTIGVSRSSDDAQFALKLGQLRAQGQAAMGAETHSKPETQESISRNQFPNHYKQESRSDEVSKDQTIEMQKESLKPGVLESHHYQEQQPALQKAQPALPLSKSTSYLHSIQDSSSSVPYQAYEVNSTPFTNIPYVYQHVLPNNVVIASDPEFRINQQQEFTQRLNVPFMYQNTAISQIQQLQLQQMQLQQGQAQLDGQQLNQQQMGQQQISQQQIDRQQAMGRQVMSQGQQLNQQGENGNEAKSVIKDQTFSGFNEPSFHSAKDNSGETSYMSQNMLLQSNNKSVPNSIEQKQQKQDPHSVMEGISPSSQPISSLGTHSITSNNVTNPTSYVDGQTINDPNIAGSNGNSIDQQQAFMRSIHANQQQILLQYLNSDKAQAALAASAEAATYGHNATPVQPFSQYPVRPTEINYLEFLPDVMVDVFEGASTAVNFMSAVDNFLEKNKNSDDEDRESTNSFLSNDSSHNSQSQ